MEYIAPFAAFLFFYALILLRRRGATAATPRVGASPQALGAARAWRMVFVIAWLIGLVGLVGSGSSATGFAVCVVAAGVIIVGLGVALLLNPRALRQGVASLYAAGRTPFPNMTLMGAVLVVIGAVWCAGGVVGL